MKFKELKTIIFDMDDTLFLERDYVKSGFRAVSLAIEDNYSINSEITFQKFWEMFLNGFRGDIFDRFLNDNKELKISVIDLINIYRFHAPRINPVDGISDLLRTLRVDRNIGLISDGYLKVQQSKLQSLKLGNYFDEIIFTDEIGKEFWKPSPLPYQEIMNRFQSKPSDCVYIGDNPQKDFISPNKMGMFSVRIRNKHGIYADLEPESLKFAATATVSNVNELKDLLILA